MIQSMHTHFTGVYTVGMVTVRKRVSLCVWPFKLLIQVVGIFESVSRMQQCTQCLGDRLILS